MKRTLFAVLLCCLILPGLIMAQGMTSSAFNGLVTDSDGNPIVGATVTVLHRPTGTVFTAVSRQDGRFNIPAVKVGGPYTVTVSMEPFKTQEMSGITLKLGEDRNLNFSLSLETIAEEITVIASNPIISESRTGAAQNVSTAVIESMPSIGRSFDDFARLAPQVDARGGGAFSAAGKSNRYNNIQIDGAVNNDLFGLSGSGTPGLASPISLDAVQEFQLVIAPYDVRQGGFTGSSLNAITRSGTNMFSGSAYYFGRNQDFVGQGPDKKAYGEFTEKQYGFRVGGPVIKDKLFFFLSGEMGDNKIPTNYVIDDSGSSNDFGLNSVTKADADRFVSILKNTYGYDPGGYGEGYKDVIQDNSKIFVRLDYNISDKHRLTFRHNYVTGSRDNNPSKASSSVFPFADVYYELTNKTNSTVAQLNSTLGNNLFNELTLNYTTIRDSRATGDTIFPQVNVTVGGSYKFTAGTEQYSGANSLDQDIIELTNNLTWYKGKHTFTVGTHNEFFNFANVYIRNYYGYWEFASLDNFEIGKSSRYYHDFYTSDPKAKWAAKFGVAQLGVYAGDNWAVMPNLNLTLGVRLDVPIINDIPAANPVVEQIYGVKTDQAASGNLLFSPRLGFNWDVNSDKKTQVRGGIGIFSGRTPYVWISNQYSNTGLEFTRFDLKNPTFAFVPDALNQPESGPGLKAGTSEVDIIDENFTYPQVLRTNLAVDHELPWGVIGTVEFIYSKNINEILYQNKNLQATGATAAGGRIMYDRNVSTSFTDVIYLTNTNKGYQYSLSVQLQKSFNKNSWANFSYTYGQSKDINSGTSSQAASNFGYNPIRFDPNDPELTWSNYDVRHRIGAAVSYTFNFLKNAPTSIGLFYGARSGRPYSTTYNYYDANGDRAAGNDLVYVPASMDEVIMVDYRGNVLADQNSAWNDLNTYISDDPGLSDYRGKIVPRNSSREPWNHGLDARLAQDIPIPGLKDNRLQLTLDIVNVLNLFNSEWGKMQYVSNQNDVPWTLTGIDAATGKQKVNFAPRSHYVLSQIGSRWQMQLGLRYSFN
ncbi:MAG: carboxypeptidase regulatory-like domain-containing protein [Candidatus Aminicenantes bacterium]|nr:carboxypeptidase regulatory-like domain-containing protein [Candidatus Aminicenantes bacterium]